MKYIILCSVLLLIILMAFMPKTSLTVKGNVKDNSGNALQYASISEKGTGNIVQSDANGDFTITVKKANAVLVVSYVGFDTKEIKLSGGLFVQVLMMPAAKNLDEVVVTGLGVSKKMNMTSSVTVAEHEGSYVSASMQAETPVFIAAKRSTPYAVSNDKSYNGYNNRSDSAFDTEDYDGIVENRFLAAKDNPLSTFSIDVDAASYSNIRRFLNRRTIASCRRCTD